MERPSPSFMPDPAEHFKNHVLTALGLSFTDGEDGSSRIGLDPAPVLCDPTGHLDIGVLGILFDMASSSALGPDNFRPFVHVDITFHRLARPEGRVTALTTADRLGGRTGVVSIDLVDEAGTLVAHSTQEMAFMKLSPEAEERMKAGDGDDHRLAFRGMFDGQLRLTERLQDRLGVTQHVPGEWAMPHAADRTNGFGALHGGSATTLMDVAASEFMAERWGADAETTRVTVRYLSPALVGPFLVRPRLLVDRGTHASLRLEVRDGGAEDAVVTLADVEVARRQV